MNNFISKSERTRAHIIETTTPYFNANGYAGTSLNDMVRITGLTRGGIYGNFENKDEIAHSVFDHNFAKMNAFMKERILAHNNAVDRLLVYPRTYRDFLKIRIFREGCPILNTSVEADDTHPGLRTKASAALQFWKKSIENQVKRGIVRKEIKPNTNPSQVAVIIISMIEGAIMQAKVSGRSHDLRIAMDYLEDMICAVRN